ncbi:MAG: hypothetical protein GY778_13660 [bacterium]|nr:hypothetical protein [bacterium]
MTEGRAEEAWGRLASLLALTANCHRDPKRSPFKVRDFNPMADRRPKAKVTIHDVKHWFLPPEVA